MRSIRSAERFLRTVGTACLAVGIGGYVLTRSSSIPLVVLGWVLLAVGGLGELACTVGVVATRIRNSRSAG